MNLSICLFLILGAPICLARASTQKAIGALHGLFGSLMLAGGFGEAFLETGCFSNEADHGLVLLGMALVGTAATAFFWCKCNQLETSRSN